MPYLEEFDQIRPFFDSEVKDVIKEIVRERGFLNFVKTFFPEQSTKKIITDLLQVQNIEEFQRHLIYPLVERVVNSSISSLRVSGLEKIEKNKSYIFMTNHRDIVLDSALLEYLFVKNGYRTTEIAIGSNLLILEWILNLVRLNRSFIVKRDIPHIELYKYSVNLSRYIRYVITEQKDSIWLAQREGRTKDGDDQTQLAVLKMLNLSNEKEFCDGFRDLNIIPLTINYEIEPLDVEKVQGLYNKIVDPTYKKTKLDDLTQMMSGMETPKGNVHYAFGTPLNEMIFTVDKIHNRREKFDEIKRLIDNEIYRNYKLSFYNYVAADIYFNTNENEKYYSKEEKLKALDYFENQINKIKGEYDVVKPMFLKIYAMPVQNHKKAINK